MAPRRKIIKRKTCKRSKKNTGFDPASIAVSVGIGAVKKIPDIAKWVGEKGKDALGYCLTLAGILAPPLWEGIKFLSKNGFQAFNKLVVGLWRDGHKRTIDVNNIKKLLNDMVKKLTMKDPALREDPIMYDIIEMNKLCFYIESLNRDGMNEVIYEDMRNQITERLKHLCAEFGKVMNEQRTVNGQEVINTN